MIHTKIQEIQSSKPPAQMQKEAWIYLLIFFIVVFLLSSPAIGVRSWSLGISLLLVPASLFLLWRSLRGWIKRAFALNNHIWKLELDYEEAKVKMHVHAKWFGSLLHEIPFDRLTAVVHKSNIPRLSLRLYSREIVNHKQPKSSFWLSKVGDYMVTALLVFFLFAIFGELPLSSLFDYDNDYDSRPTAISMVEGKNVKSLIMLSSYGWDAKDLREVLTTCKNFDLRILDKRPLKEKQENIFI